MVDGCALGIEIRLLELAEFFFGRVEVLVVRHLIAELEMDVDAVAPVGIAHRTVRIAQRDALLLAAVCRRI